MTALCHVRRSFAPQPRRLIHGDARAGFAIQESLEVKAGKLIIRSLTNMRCKCHECAGIARFQFGKCLQITLCRRIFVLFRPQRLEGPKSFRSAPQQKVSHRTAPEVLYLCREDCADDTKRGSRWESHVVSVFMQDRRSSAISVASNHSASAGTYSSKASAQLTARAAWSGCSPGAPNSTCKASPTIFATVPSWPNTMSVMPVR
jgi:hypothetical protein